MTIETDCNVTIMTGNQAVAEALRQISPDVAAVYPITPQTDIAERLSTYVADGLLEKTIYLPVESEHSAMSACIGAAAAGARAVTATSSQGLAYMHEVLYIASGLRLPMIMANVNRALSAPINIHCDHSDSMGTRDTGWIQLYSENAQDAYDNVLQAVRIAEHKDVRLPVMINMDGFIISHGSEVLELVNDEKVKAFIGDYNPTFSLLDVDNPVTIGPFDGLQGYYFEHKKAQVEAMESALRVIAEVADEFATISGRNHGYFEAYHLADAEVALIALNSAAGTCKMVVDELREQGLRVGMLKLRVFRPFPSTQISHAIGDLKAIGVLDRAVSPGLQGGPVFSEVRSALFDNIPRPYVFSFVYGLGGREFKPEHVREAFFSLLNAGTTNGKKQVQFLGLREEVNP